MGKWGGRASRRLVVATLAHYGDVCHLCGKPGATTADHLIPRSRGGADTLDNLRPAHLRCNQARGNRPLDEYRAAGTVPVTVVVGPPAAGKSSYIADRALAADLVIDLDEIATALRPRALRPDGVHVYPAHVRHVAQAARKAAISAAGALTTGGGMVWIVDTRPSPATLADYARRGWSVVVVDPGREIALDRARRAGRPPRALRAIDEWYADPPRPARSATPSASTSTPLAPSREW